MTCSLRIDKKMQVVWNQSQLSSIGINMWFLVFLFGVAAFFIFKLWKSQSYWKQKGIPYDVPVPFFGMMLDLFIGRKSFYESLDEIYRAHPGARYVGYYKFTTPVLLLKDPELIKQICVKDYDAFSERTTLIPDGAEPLWTNNLFAAKGDKWKGLRTTLTPSFTSSKMKLMFNMIEECSRQFVNYFTTQESETIDVELKDIFSRYANDVIASTTFGLKIDSLRERNNEFYTMGKAYANFTGAVFFKVFLYTLFTTPMKLLDVRVFPREATAYFSAFFKKALKYREQNNIKRPDMLHLLLEARKNDEVKSKAKSLNISDEEIIAQAMVFFLGGFDTVSNSLCFTIYELAVHQDIQGRLRQEVDELWEETKGKPTFEDISNMKYLDMVVSENLRKNAPMAFVERQAVRPYTIEPINEKEKPLELKIGQNCLYPVTSLHWDENYFPNARKFDPERFSDENKHKIIPGSYVPFGVGPRVCIGARFSTLEMKSLLCHLIRNFEVIPNDKTEIPLQLLKDSFSLTPKNGFQLSFKKRQNDSY